MSHAFYSDAADKADTQLSRSEQAAVESVRQALEGDPEQGRQLPGTDPLSAPYAVELLPEGTGARGISVVHRHARDLDASLILCLIASS